MTYKLKCGDCGRENDFTARTLRGILDRARDDGWAINRDNSIQWCPNCAEKHRHVGKKPAANSAKTQTPPPFSVPGQLPGQLAIEDI